MQRTPARTSVKYHQRSSTDPQQLLAHHQPEASSAKMDLSRDVLAYRVRNTSDRPGQQRPRPCSPLTGIALLLTTAACDSILSTLHCRVSDYTFNKNQSSKYGPLVPLPKSQQRPGGLCLIECDTDHAERLYSSRCFRWRRVQMEG